MRRASGRRLAVSALALAGVLASCGGASGGDGERWTIGILRSVEGDRGERSLLEGLAEGDYGREEIELLGADRTEVQADADEAEVAAKRMVADGADVIVALSTTTALAAAAATEDVPILFMSTDPVATGLVDDARSPAGNLTGVAYRVPADRTLALGRELLGELDAVGCLYGEDPAAQPPQDDLRDGGEALGVEVRCVGFARPDEVAGAVTEVVAADVDAVVIINAPATARSFPELATALRDTRLPVFANTPNAFSVLTLVPDAAVLYRQLGRQAARLLDGVTVGKIPVEDPASYLLQVNMEQARRIGLTVPRAVLDRADSVVGAQVSDR